MSASMSAPMSDDRSFQVLEAIPSRLEVSPDRPRRRWSAQAKMALIAETLKPEANVSAIARQAGIWPGQVCGGGGRGVQADVGQCDAPELRLGFVDVTPTPSSMIEIV